jgi:hypothetical protein
MPTTNANAALAAGTGTAADLLGLSGNPVLLGHVETTVQPDLIGIAPAVTGDFERAAVGPCVLTGAGTVLTGDTSFRGLFSFAPTATSPALGEGGISLVMHAGYIIEVFAVRVDATSTYKVGAAFVTALAESTFAEATITIEDDDPMNLGLGFTRSALTGEIVLYWSHDGGAAWEVLPQSSQDFIAGDLADTAGLDIFLLSQTNVRWVEMFWGRWAETADFEAMDASEVIAFNQGPLIQTGVGGDFFDIFDASTKALSEEASRASYSYKERSEAVDGGRTITVDWEVIVASPATSPAPANQGGAFAFDISRQVEGGPVESGLLPPILMSSNSTMDIDSTMVPGIYSTDGKKPDWKVVLVNMFGVGERALPNAVVSDVKWVLNGINSCAFRLPTLDTANRLISIPDQEVQVWRGDKLMFWGPIVRGAALTDMIEYQCMDPAWYFTKRLIGRPETNHIPNGSFEGLGGWFMGQYAPSEPGAKRNPAHWTSTTSTKYSLTGGRSLYQSATASMMFGIHSIAWFDARIDPAQDPEGITWTAVAWAYLDDDFHKPRLMAYNWDGDSAASGLTMYRMSLSQHETKAPKGITVPKLLDSVVASVDEKTERRKWVRLEVSLVQPAGTAPRTDRIQIDLGTPIGGIYWDEVSLTRNERLYFNHVDQAQIMQGLVEHAQSTAYGKSNLNIATSCKATKIKRTRAYEFFNHEMVSGAIGEFAQLWRGMDWVIAITPTDRIFRTYYPMKGSRKAAYPLILGKNIASINVPTDGEQVANRVIMMSNFSGGGQGSGREEVYATDTSGFSSGLVLEAAFTAVAESPVTSLTDQAQRALRQSRVPVRIPSVVTMEGVGQRLIGVLQTGDVVPVVATWGGMQLDGDYRIIEIGFDPASDTMALTLNPFEEWNDPTKTWGIIT